MSIQASRSRYRWTSTWRSSLENINRFCFSRIFSGQSNHSVSLGSITDWERHILVAILKSPELDVQDVRLMSRSSHNLSEPTSGGAYFPWPWCLLIHWKSLWSGKPSCMHAVSEGSVNPFDEMGKLRIRTKTRELARYRCRCWVQICSHQYEYSRSLEKQKRHKAGIKQYRMLIVNWCTDLSMGSGKHFSPVEHSRLLAQQQYKTKVILLWFPVMSLKLTKIHQY